MTTEKNDATKPSDDGATSDGAMKGPAREAAEKEPTGGETETASAAPPDISDKNGHH